MEFLSECFSLPVVATFESRPAGLGFYLSYKLANEICSTSDPWNTNYLKSKLDCHSMIDDSNYLL